MTANIITDPAQARACLNDRLTARKVGARYHLSGPYDPQQRWKGAGGRNVKTESGWVCEVRDLETLRRCAQVRGPILVDEETARDLGAAAESVAASRQADAPAGVDLPCPEGLTYLPYQKAGILYALRVFGDKD